MLQQALIVEPRNPAVREVGKVRLRDYSHYPRGTESSQMSLQNTLYNRWLSRIPNDLRSSQQGYLFFIPKDTKKNLQ